MASLSTTATLNEPEISGLPDYGTRLRRARLGLFVALIPVLMLFVSFTSAYVVRQGLPTLDPRTNNFVRDWIPVTLPRLLLLNTLVLVVSSVSMELARRQIRARATMEMASTGTQEVPWLGITVVLGLAFLLGQWTAWKQLAANGFYVSTTPSSSFVYLLTGTHAAHLLGGIVALFIAGGASLVHGSLKTRSIIVDVTAWYWHFMALLWVYIFCLMKFAG